MFSVSRCPALVARLGTSRFGVAGPSLLLLPPGYFPPHTPSAGSITPRMGLVHLRQAIDAVWNSPVRWVAGNFLGNHHGYVLSPFPVFSVRYTPPPRLCTNTSPHRSPIASKSFYTTFQLRVPPSTRVSIAWERTVSTASQNLSFRHPPLHFQGLTS
jgi:hypothetical protein